MPIYRSPVVDGAPKHWDRVTADLSNIRKHYQGDVVYVASKHGLNVYSDDDSVGAVDSVPGVDEPYPDDE